MGGGWASVKTATLMYIPGTSVFPANICRYLNPAILCSKDATAGLPQKRHTKMAMMISSPVTVLGPMADPPAIFLNSVQSPPPYQQL